MATGRLRTGAISSCAAAATPSRPARRRSCGTSSPNVSSACRGAADGLQLLAGAGPAPCAGSLVPGEALPPCAPRGDRDVGGWLGPRVLARARPSWMDRRVDPRGAGWCRPELRRRGDRVRGARPRALFGPVLLDGRARAARARLRARPLDAGRLGRAHRDARVARGERERYGGGGTACRRSLAPARWG